MAEFGENVRRAREEMGITQQTLADKLYVTRQAVSRWENGSRYPDLLTANRLAAALDTSLDELLATDDMHTYPEVNPVIEYPLYKRIQTALFSAAFVTNLVQLMWYVFFNLTENRIYQTDYEAAEQISKAIFAGLITAVLLYGLICSVKDMIDPRRAAGIAVTLVGIDILYNIVVYILAWKNYTPYDFVPFLVYFVTAGMFIAAVLVFFLSNRPLRPIPVYILGGLSIVLIIASYIINLIDLLGTAKLTKYLITSSLRLFALILIPTLILYMAAVLYRKRRLATN